MQVLSGYRLPAAGENHKVDVWEGWAGEMCLTWKDEIRNVFGDKQKEL